MMSDIQQVTLESLRPVTSVEPADICQIRQPMTLLTYSATTSQRFLSIQSRMHLEDKVLSPIFDAQFHSSPTRTCTCERSGLRNNWIGLWGTGWLLTSRMSPYSTCLGQMVWSGAGGGLESAWTQGLRRRRSSMVVGRLRSGG